MGHHIKVPGDGRPLPESWGESVTEALREARCASCGSSTEPVRGKLHELRVRCTSCGLEQHAQRRPTRTEARRP